MLKETLELLKCEIADLEEENKELVKQKEELLKLVCYWQGVAYGYKEENRNIKSKIEKTFKS